MRSFAWILLFALLLPPVQTFAQDGPSWMKRKKAVEKEKAEEAEEKDKELPVVGGDSGESGSTISNPFSELSSAAKPPPETNLLFKSAGLTDSFNLDFGKLNQTEISGPLLSFQFGMGWWWQPDLIFSFWGRAGGMIWNSYLFMNVGVGPQLKYIFRKKWALTGYVGYQFSQGLTRVKIARLPIPGQSTLAARRGIVYGAQVAYLFWTKRDLAVGPAISYWRGTQDERSFGIVTFGVTFQAGRPNYTGDLTDR